MGGGVKCNTNDLKISSFPLYAPDDDYKKNLKSSVRQMLIRAYCLCGHRLSQEMFKKKSGQLFFFAWKQERRPILY